MTRFFDCLRCAFSVVCGTVAVAFAVAFAVLWGGCAASVAVSMVLSVDTVALISTSAYNYLRRSNCTFYCADHLFSSSRGKLRVDFSQCSAAR